jgi:dTDP-D-glucose 4,6-dehydratase
MMCASNLLKSLRPYLQWLHAADKETFRYLLVSADELYCNKSPADPILLKAITSFPRVLTQTARLAATTL